MPFDRKDRRHYKKCQLCELQIKDLENQIETVFHKPTLEELTGRKYITSSRTSGETRHGFFHKSCFEALDVPSQRRLICIDFTTKILSVENEIWVRLNERGEIRWDTLSSDLPEIDSRIQGSKKRGKLTEKDKEWLEELMDYA